MVLLEGAFLAFCGSQVLEHCLRESEYFGSHVGIHLSQKKGDHDHVCTCAEMQKLEACGQQLRQKDMERGSNSTGERERDRERQGKRQRGEIVRGTTTVKVKCRRRQG